MERKVWAQTLCKAAAPHLKMLQKQASYLKRRVTKIVKDDLYHALHSDRSLLLLSTWFLGQDQLLRMSRTLHRPAPDPLLCPIDRR